MRRSRTALVAVLGTAAVVALLGAWFTIGWSDARARAQSLIEVAAAQPERQAMTLATDLGAALESIRAGEDARAYYEYQNLFHDPRGASKGLSVNPSPLAERTADPLIAAHYQIDPGGTLTIPPVNDDVPELSQQSLLADNQKILGELRTAKAALGQELVAAAPVIVASKAAPTRDPQPAQQVQRIDPEAFAQNTFANQVFQEIQQTKAPKPAAAAKKIPRANEPVEIRIASFAWRTAEIAAQPTLVATRTIETPAGTLAQGFVLDHAAAQVWLAARTEAEVALVRAGDSVSPGEAPLPAIPGWAVRVESDSAIAAAGLEASRLRKRFWTWFVPAAALALLGLALVVFVVYRAETLARERSRFAAAAAHELRTPLAGLQLYGEMLADGLGDPAQRQSYAQRISDEASRLGRVVNNVLGFTQLERGALAVDAQPGDLAAATRRCIERTRPSLEAAGMVVETAIPERLLARFDEDAHARIVGNLLDNAEKYTRDRGERRVDIEVGERGGGTEGGVAIVTVTDRGAGVPSRSREQIFRPFTRASDEDGAAGLGLGLALARTLARDQGGDLRCEAGGDQLGARFVLELPLV